MKPPVTPEEAQVERDAGADLLRAIRARQGVESESQALLARALEAKYGTPAPAGDGEGS